MEKLFNRGPNYRKTHSTSKGEEETKLWGEEKHLFKHTTVQKPHSLAGGAVTATRLLRYGPSAYQIPPFRYMGGLGRREPTGYLLSQ